MVETWIQYVNELKSFICLPSFFAMFMKKSTNINLLANLLSGKTDTQ